MCAGDVAWSQWLVHKRQADASDHCLQPFWWRTGSENAKVTIRFQLVNPTKLPFVLTVENLVNPIKLSFVLTVENWLCNGRCRHGYFHVVNNDYTHWEMYAIGGSAEPTINSQGNRYAAPMDRFAKEVQHLKTLSLLKQSNQKLLYV